MFSNVCQISCQYTTYDRANECDKSNPYNQHTCLSVLDDLNKNNSKHINKYGVVGDDIERLTDKFSDISPTGILVGKDNQPHFSMDYHGMMSSFDIYQPSATPFTSPINNECVKKPTIRKLSYADICSGGKSNLLEIPESKSVFTFGENASPTTMITTPTSSPGVNYKRSIHPNMIVDKNEFMDIVPDVPSNKGRPTQRRSNRSSNKGRPTQRRSNRSSNKGRPTQRRSNMSSNKGRPNGKSRDKSNWRTSNRAMTMPSMPLRPSKTTELGRHTRSKSSASPVLSPIPEKKSRTINPSTPKGQGTKPHNTMPKRKNSIRF